MARSLAGLALNRPGSGTVPVRDTRENPFHKTRHGRMHGARCRWAVSSIRVGRLTTV